MDFVVCAIRDRASDCFLTPFFEHTRNSAIRQFSDVVNNPNNPVGAHPDDYDLFYLGVFDNNSAVFTLIERPEQLALGKDCLRKGG